MDTKQVYLDGVGSGTFVYKTLTRDDHTVKVHGNIGLSFFHMVADVQIRGNMHHLDNRMLAVWVHEDGAWKLLAVQSGAIPPQAK